MKNIIRGLGVSGAKRDIQSPYVAANPISKATLWWLNNHIWRGFRRPLKPTDIYTVVPDEASAVRAKALEREWKELGEDGQKKRYSLLKTVLRVDWKLFFVSFILILLGEVSKFVQPFLIAQLVSFFKGKGYVTKEQAWGYAFGMVALTVFYAVVSTYGQFLGQVVAMRWRTACTALMSRKASRLSSKALSELSSGTVINLLATDVEKFYNAASEFRGLFVGPFVLLALVLLVGVKVQVSFLPALAFVILLTALRMKMGNISGQLRLKLADWSDKRILLVTEIVSAMRTIKAYCWEKPFGNRAQELRSKEIKSAGWVVFLNGLNLNLGHSCDRIVTFLLVLTFILSGHTVDYTLAIQILTWMKMGQLGFLNFPIGYSMWKQMEASLSRIQDFLIAEEFTGYDRIRKESSITDPSEAKVVLKNVSASWATSEKNISESAKKMKQSLLRSISTLNAVTTKNTFVASGTFSLRNISIDFRNGQLIGLVGPVGSGKTSLLLVILGNLTTGAGTRTLMGRIGYVPQQPWIRADTVRNNILMGEKMDRARYTAVLQACALQKDIAVMPNGDSTLIGDKGSSLSGGQRSRISLARAVYKRADIYILDDPFSSLDSKVGTHIFHECVRKLLKDKLVIMATHYIHLLKYTDQVLVLKEGKVLGYGALEDVQTQINLRDLIKDPEHNMLDEDEIHDVFEKEDKKNLLMPLLMNAHIKKEHAHIPKKRATPFKIYLSYFKAGFGYIFMTLFCLFLIAQQAFSITGEWWLVYLLSGGSPKGGYSKAKNYSSYGGKHDTHDSHDSPTYGPIDPVDNGTHFRVFDSSLEDGDISLAVASSKYGSSMTSEQQRELLGPYAAFVWISVIMGVLSVVAGSFFIISAARNLYNSMFNRILWAPMSIFSSDKTGEIVNRFARDTGRMDDIIPITIFATFLTAAIILSHASYICVINYFVVLVTLPFLVCLTLFVLYCVRSIRDTKRLESEFRTPTFEHLQNLLVGLEVIRAFEMETLMVKEADGFLDRHTAAWHMYIGSMYWMKMRLNWLVSVYLAGVLCIALASPNKEEMATPIGLSLAYIIVFMNRIQYFATYSTMLDANMTSVEHVAEYEHLAQEPPAHNDYPLPDGWPSTAQISFKHVDLVYPGSDTHALRDMSFEVKGCEKIGIVGRTGAGKTSLFNVLLRLEKYKGCIEIDGVDTTKIGLADLRNKVTFILQEPVLHNGTLRYNLDPLSKYTDEQIWDALEKVCLKKKVSRLPGRLNLEIEADGSNFSGGQKQLLCMARALLNMKKIMLLDEITANTDKETDELIHSMINEVFKDCTILHISHRIEALMNYDNILVIAEGSISEYGHPYVLLQNHHGPFSSMVQQLGRQQAKLLTKVAKESYQKKFGHSDQDMFNLFGADEDDDSQVEGVPSADCSSSESSAAQEPTGDDSDERKETERTASPVGSLSTCRSSESVSTDGGAESPTEQQLGSASLEEATTTRSTSVSNGHEGSSTSNGEAIPGDALSPNKVERTELDDNSLTAVVNGQSAEPGDDSAPSEGAYEGCKHSYNGSEVPKNGQDGSGVDLDGSDRTVTGIQTSEKPVSDSRTVPGTTVHYRKNGCDENGKTDLQLADVEL